MPAGRASFPTCLGAMTALEGMRQSWAAGRPAPGTCTPPPGHAAVCYRTVKPQTVRALSRRPDLGPRCCCTARPILTWRDGRTPRRCPTRCRQQIDGYVAMARGFEPPDARYLNNHRGHFVFLKPEEREVHHRRTDPPHDVHCNRAGTEAADRGFARCGWSQLVIPITPGEERALEDWARIKRAFD